MAAFASVVSLMRVIHDLERHPSPPISLDKRLVDSITQRIAYFRDFLQYSYNTPDDQEEGTADPLEMRIASAAHAAEDAIEYHIVETIKHKRNKKRTCTNIEDSINRCRGVLRGVIEEMDSIKEVAVIDEAPRVVVRDDQLVDLTTTNSTRTETSLVGPDGALLEIMEKLVGGQLDCQVIPIVGMGGIGKTFLAKTIYAKPLIKERFDVCAWATISQNYDAGDILCQLLSRKEKPSEKPSVDELGLELHKHLFCRRFLIVMDDMWSIDAWDKVQRFFPNNGNGSRVLVTTRLSQLSLQLNGKDDYSLRMSFLDKASSWELFSKTVFGCPPELKEIGEKIVDNCRGLPLSIAVVGGLLKKMDGTRASWESILDNFTSAVNMDNDKHCLRLLKLSYNHLPVYLKPCFLYMGVFEEDEEIRVSTLVNLWVSEGFLKPTNGEAIETTARGFLHDLVDRNLILVGELGCTGRLKSCRMHDLVRDMCLKECRKEGFYHVIGECNLSPLPPPRRVVIHGDISEHEDRVMSSARTIIFNQGEVPLCRDTVLLRTLHSHREIVQSDGSYLKSVVLHYVNLRHLDIKANKRMSSLLSSVVSLWNLHTLTVVYNFSYVPALLAGVWEMPQFRHIEFVLGYARLPSIPTSSGEGGGAVVVMENLHTIKGVRNFKCSQEMIKRIPNIKRLKLEYYSHEYDDDEEDNDEDDDDSYDDDDSDDEDDSDDDEEEEEDDDDDDDSGSDADADVDADYGDNRGSDDDDKFDNMDDDYEEEDDDPDDMHFMGNLKYLRTLEVLSINFTGTHNINFPHSLKKLSLITSCFHKWNGGVLEKLGRLPFLEKLKLTRGRFEKREWRIAQGEFPSLKYLELCDSKCLENWTASEEDSPIFPRLEYLKLEGLRVLKKVPFELGNIDTLKSIKVLTCGEGVVNSVKEMFDEQVELQGGEDQLSFHVVVNVVKRQHHLLSLACPNFYVNLM